jgi:hypothetical protein
MNKLQKIRDRQGRDVLLSPERWRHIVSAHPEIEIHEKGSPCGRIADGRAGGL